MEKPKGGNQQVLAGRKARQEREAAARQQLDADVAALAAALHPSLATNPIVLANLRFQQKLLGAAEPLIDRARTSGLKGTEWTTLTKLLTAHTSAMSELLSRIPPRETERPEHKVPDSVLAWLSDPDTYKSQTRQLREYQERRAGD